MFKISSIFKIETLIGVSSYIVYTPRKTTLGAILETFEFNNSLIPTYTPYYKSETLKRFIKFEDYSKTPEELGLERNEVIILFLMLLDIIYHE